MSDRDEALQSLAEEIAGRFADTYREDEGLDWSAEDAEDVRYVKGRLAALLASRGDLVRAEIVALSDQLHRALGELGQLRGALQEIIKDAPEEGFQPTREWTGNADDTFEEGSKMSHAWCADIARAALTASPLSERAGALFDAVDDVVHADGEELEEALARLALAHNALNLALEPDTHKRVHRCLRCGEEFECPVPDRCTARYHVLPRHVVIEDGQPKVVEHCPDRAELAKGGESG